MSERPQKPPHETKGELIAREPLLAGKHDTNLEDAVLAEWRADAQTYWWRSLYLAIGLGILAGIVLLVMQNPHAWTGPVAALIAIFARAAFLKSEALGESWRMTRSRLIGPMGRIVPLSSIERLTTVFGDVLVISRSGDKILLKYLKEPAAVIAAIERQRGRK
jgi:hypothetical protein